MKHTIKKCLFAGILSLSLLTGSATGTGLNPVSPFVSTAFAAEHYQVGGRMDITLGNHNQAVFVTARLSNKTRVQMWDKNWNSVWAGNCLSGSKVLSCGSNVYTITFYLDRDKMAYVRW